MVGAIAGGVIGQAGVDLGVRPSSKTANHSVGLESRIPGESSKRFEESRISESRISGEIRRESPKILKSKTLATHCDYSQLK